MDLINKNFLQDISELLDSARKQAKIAVFGYKPKTDAKILSDLRE